MEVGGSSTFSSLSALTAAELSQHCVRAAPPVWCCPPAGRAREALRGWLMAVSVCPKHHSKLAFVWLLEERADNDRAVEHPMPTWGSDHFLPEMSWPTHPLYSLICTFFPPSSVFLQAEEYLWQALYFVNDISVCKLIFMQTPPWIYSVQHAASFA